MDWKKELGIQIRDGRRDSLLRQEDLRERADVHINMISRYERGDSAPELDVLIRLAIALNIEELRIGDYVITIRAADGVAAPSGPRQLRLEYGKEYVFDGGNSSMKIQPSKEGLFITPEKRKAIGSSAA
jgi:transcriptional regulator with XRE-family HTH domain